MSISEAKGGARWVPGIGFNPDSAGRRAAAQFHGGKNLAAETAYAIAMLSPLIVSVALLTGLLGAIYLFSATAIASLGTTFTVSDFIVPPAFFLIQLTSRRYGAGRALAQLAFALLLCGAAVLADPSLLRAIFLVLPVVNPGAVAAFAIAFTLANCAGIAIFECARGPVWWKAPAYGALASALVFSASFYPLMGDNWALALHGAQLAAESGLLLIPYWLLRGAIRPLPGLNG